MMHPISILIAVLTLSTLATGTPTTFTTGKYIIKLAPRASTTRLRTFMQTYNTQAKASGNEEAAASAIHYTYSAVMKGMAGYFTTDFLNQLRGSEHGKDVEYIVPDGKKHIVGLQKNPPSWGLTRVGQRTSDLTKGYSYPDAAGEGVDVWVVDTGIFPNHTDFGGRAKMMKSFIPNEAAVDLHGHGTHCAGTVGSASYGVAKKVNIFGVKVLDAQGSGDDSSVIAGIDYVAQNMRPGKTVLSMSLGGDKSQALDDAVVAAINKGVVVVVAAGNESQDACNTSPAGVPDALTIGATDRNDALAYFSNTGTCVDLLAPGVSIKSLWKGRDGATQTISGTSMATPHTAGIAALYMSMKSYSSAKDVMKDMVDNATKDKISGVPADTVNLLAYNSLPASMLRRRPAMEPAMAA